MSNLAQQTLPPPQQQQQQHLLPQPIQPLQQQQQVTGVTAGSVGVINGGRFDFDDGGTYCGGWHDGKAHGHGICTGPKGQGEYSGSWHYGFEVSGVYKWPSGATFEGQWQNGKRHGIGVEYRGKWVYKGEWTQGYKGRYGVRASLLSNAKYEGTWANGLQDGYGSETYADGGTYQGQWLRGMRHGYGVRSSAPYGHCNITKAIVTSATNASLQSLDTEGESQMGDQRRDIVRGGFVLVARNSFRDSGKRRNSLVEKTSGIRGNFLFKNLRLRKQRSTGDIDVKSNKSTTPSLVSSREASETGSAASFKDQDQDVGSNASFLSQNGDISDPTTTETYAGEWKNDKRCGFGVCERSDGLRYEGEWYNNKKYGYGATIFRDGTREEGKYKNNQLVTNVRKKHLFVIRSSKVRERIESAIVAAHRAQQIALQKSDIAVSRTSTARSKAEQADFGAGSARNDSQMAYITAKQYGGIDLSQSHSLDAPLRRRLSDFSQIRRNTRDSGGGGGVGGPGHQPPLDNRNAIQPNNPNVAAANRQFLDPNEPFGGRRGSFRTHNNQSSMATQQQQAIYPQHGLQPQQQQQHRMLQQQLPNQLPHHMQPQHNFSRQQHHQQQQQSSVHQLLPHHPNYQQSSIPSMTNDPFGQTFSDHFDQYQTLVSKYSNIQKQRSFSPNSSTNPMISSNVQNISNLNNNRFSNYNPLPPDVQPFNTSSSGSNRNLLMNFNNKSQIPSTPGGDPLAAAAGVSLDECLKQQFRTAAAVAGTSGGINNDNNNNNNDYENEDTFDESSGPQPKQWRTASLYRPPTIPTAAQNHNQKLSAGGGGGGGGGGLKRKPSLQPNVVKQVNKPMMSREEVSVLSHNRREQQRQELELKEKLSRNPLLYLTNPRFTNWLNRQQLVMLVLVINISLFILFFKLLI